MNFKLADSPEYRQIKEMRDTILHVTGRGILPQVNAINSAVAMVINQYLKPMPHNAGMKSNEEKETNSQKREIYDLMVNPETFDSKVSGLTGKLSKNIYELFAISNYAFAEVIFLYDCEQPELKKFRQGGQATEDARVKTMRIIRRKAEDFLKNGHFDDAIRLFKEADEKYEHEYTITYQLAMLYFFDKADYTESLAYFTKSYKSSMNKSKTIFLNSLVFISAIMRMRYCSTKENDILTEAYLAAKQANSLDPEYPFSCYALIQCSALYGSEASRKDEAPNVIKELIARHRFFSIQMLSDISFMYYMPELFKLYSNIVDELVKMASDVFAGIDTLFERVAGASKFIAIPSKLAALRNAYNDLSHKFVSKRYFDVIDVVSECQTLYSSLQELFNEMNANKMYYELKQSIEAIAEEYKREAADAGAPFTRLEIELHKVAEDIERHNKKYPQGKTDKNGDVLEAAWFQYTGFIFFNMGVGFLASVFFISMTALTLILLQVEFSWLIYLMFGGYLIFIPIFGKICGEVSHYTVESKREKLDVEQKKISALIEAKRIFHDEEQAKLVHKYALLIAEKHKIPISLSEKLLECAAAGNYEQIKAYLQSGGQTEKTGAEKPKSKDRVMAAFN